MTDSATPQPRGRRPINYPAAIPRTMTTAEQRAEIDALVKHRGAPVAEVVRDLIADGLMCREIDPFDRSEIERVAKLDRVKPSYALARFIEYAARKIDRVRRGEDLPAEIMIDQP